MSYGSINVGIERVFPSSFWLFLFAVILVLLAAVETGIVVIVEEELDIMTAMVVVEDNNDCQKNHHSQHLLVACLRVPYKETLIIYLKSRRFELLNSKWMSSLTLYCGTHVNISQLVTFFRNKLV